MSRKIIFILLPTLIFGHIRIAEFTGRPANWEELLINSWNSKVKDTDYVLHLGDFALTNLSRISELLTILKGKIILLPGNHDRGRQLKLYKRELFMVLEKEGFTWKNYIFTHRPLEKVPVGFINLAGHTHNLYINDGQHYNVCPEIRDITKLNELLSSPPFN
jgi:calcineurin-like phosphoesterase family protein